MAQSDDELYDIVRHENIRIPVNDETVSGTRYQPLNHNKGELPVILIATPYRKDDRITFGSWDPSIQYLAKHGYEVVVVDLIGTGASTGSKEPFSGEEAEELKKVIDWIADQDWTNGKVGMYGLSYGAFTQWQAASAQPDALEALVPIAVTPYPYTSSYTGGAFNPLKRATWASQMTALAALPPSKRDDEGKWARIWEERLKDLDNKKPWLFHFIENNTKNDFWKSRDVYPKEIDTPALVVCGTRDIHTGPMVEFFTQIDVPKRMILGPWRHNMPEQGNEEAIDFRRQAVEWFDYFLKGINNKALDHKKVEYWTERDGGWSSEGVWREIDSWPTISNNGNSDSIIFSLTPDGLEFQEECDYDNNLERKCEIDQTVGMRSLHRILGHSNRGIDTTPDDVRSISFETSKITDPIEFTGSGKAVLYVQPTAPDALLSIRVTDIDMEGHSRLITSGYIKLSHINGDEKPEKLIPGKEYEVEVPLHPKSHIIEEGHRVRVSISASQFPRALPPIDQGSFTILSSPDQQSIVELPGKTYDGCLEINNRIDMKEPDKSVPVNSEYVYNKDSSLELSRRDDDTAEFNLSSNYSIDLPHAEYMTISNDVNARVHKSKTRTYVLEDTTDITLKYETETIVVRSQCRVSQEYSLLSTSVEIDGISVYKNSWRHI